MSRRTAQKPNITNNATSSKKTSAARASSARPSSAVPSSAKSNPFDASSLKSNSRGPVFPSPDFMSTASFKKNSQSSHSLKDAFSQMSSSRNASAGSSENILKSSRTKSSGSTSAKIKGAGAASSGSTRASSRGTTGGASAGTSVLISRIGLIATVLVLIVFGLVMLYSASSVYSYNLFGDYTSVFSKQLIFVAAGTAVAMVVAFVTYRFYSLPVSVILLGICIPLLVWVLMEDAALGARRWIDFGYFSLQPSEFAKIAIVLVLACLMDRIRRDGYSISLVVAMIVSFAVPVGLILLETDLGTSIISIVGVFAVLWFGGAPKRVVGLLALGLVGVALVAIFGTGFRQARITAWLDPYSDPLGDGYQLLNSYYAFGGGGLFGVGLGLSKQKFSWLPQSENDFIFAIVGEELGFVGALLVVLLFVSLVFFSLRVARNAPDAIGAMIAGSAGVMIGAQAFLNMLCVVGVLPITGKPLPFFSAGGSAVISTLILVGLTLSVSLRSTEETVYDFRREQFSVVNGGGGRKVGESTSSILTRLPNPAAFVAGGIQRSAEPERSPSRRRVASSEKVVPISRGRAARQERERATGRKKQNSAPSSRPRRSTEPALSMASLRRGRVRRSS